MSFQSLHISALIDPSIILSSMVLLTPLSTPHIDLYHPSLTAHYFSHLRQDGEVSEGVLTYRLMVRDPYDDYSLQTIEAMRPFQIEELLEDICENNMIEHISSMVLDVLLADRTLNRQA
jgi:hypothetical protein